MQNKKRLLWQLPFLAFLVVGTVIIVGRQRSTPYQHDKGMVFGTVYHITYQSDRNLKDGIEAELAKVDASLSPFNKNSVITAINQNRDIAVDKMFAEVFSLAMKISDTTDGAFDITVAGTTFKGTEQQKWLQKHCWDYGFIVRYQEDKEAITGFLAECWHIRYVGVRHSVIMRDQNLCLEEYLGETD